jgi:glyoxylase-like metal-dependent hydrolase (beta-lactamase superfamily II)
VFSVGKATITRIEETCLPCYPLRDIFPDFTDAHLAEHKSWLAPHHYEAETGRIKLAVHSWLLQVDGKKILVDSCCGNNKVKPGRPFWNMLNVDYLERLARAGARPEEIDLVMCTHLHHDHVGWNTRQKDGKWVPTFPNARYVFSKPDVDYFSKIDADPKEGPAELGTFRECVVPILEYGRADLVSGGAYRLNDFIEIDSAPGH